MTPPTFTDAELLALSGSIERLRDELMRSTDFCEHTAAGYLLEMDDAALAAAKTTIDRLYLWRKWHAISPESYLPAPTLAPVPEPQSLQLQPMTDAELYAAWRGDRIPDPDYRAECKRRGWAKDFGGQYIAPSRVQS